MTEGGFDNENFVSDEVDDTITLLFLGLPRAGKTAIKERVFDQLPENHLNYLQPTTEIKCNTMQCFKKIKIIDFPGCKNLLEDLEEDMWSVDVDQGGLGISSDNKNIAAIYIIDSHDHEQSYRNYEESIMRMKDYAKALTNYNQDIRFEIFLHKTDQLGGDEQELAIQESTFDHVAEAERIREQGQLESLLNMLISKASVAKAYLYDVNTKLYVATDSMQHTQHYSMHMEICAGMIDMATTINNYYESRGDDGEDRVTTFDENTECWSNMHNQLLTCLFGITPSLALVCVLKDDVAKMAKFVTVNAGTLKLLCNLDCSIQHFLNYVESKCDPTGGRVSGNDGHVSPGEHLHDTSGEPLDSPRSEHQHKQTIVRVGGRRQKINLDECDAVFDVMDMEGQLMDLSLCNKRDRVSDVLSHNFHYSFCRVHREREAMKAVDCTSLASHAVVWNAAKQFKGARAK